MHWELLRILPNHKKQQTLPALNLLELVVAVAFIAIIFTAGFSVFDVSLKIINRAKLSTTAELLAQDLLELGISKRNEGWTSLVPGQYYFVEDPDPQVGFVFTAGQEVIEPFTRYLQISTVNRDSNDNIVASGGTVDPDTMRFEAVITWQVNGLDQDIHLYQYVTNWNSF